MPYRITRHPEQLLWVVMEGHLSLHQAESYLRELWDLLDSSPVPQDILVDGRRIGGAAPGARRRTEQIIHHPRVGHLAFVVGDLHLLLLAPLMKLVAGVGLFADEHAAQAYLRSARGLPPMADLGLPNMPPPPADLSAPSLRPCRRWLPRRRPRRARPRPQSRSPKSRLRRARAPPRRRPSQRRTQMARRRRSRRCGRLSRGATSATPSPARASCRRRSRRARSTPPSTRPLASTAAPGAATRSGRGGVGREV